MIQIRDRKTKRRKGMPESMARYVHTAKGNYHFPVWTPKDSLKKSLTCERSKEREREKEINKETETREK